jgi:poly(A) polymerase
MVDVAAEELKVDPGIVEEALARRLSRDEDGGIRVRDVIDRLLEAGVGVYAVGGAPRDWLAGVPCDDVDLAVDRDIPSVLQILRAAFPGFDPPIVGIKGFGLIRWGDPEVEQVDVNILRSWRAAVGSDEFMASPFAVGQDLAEDALTRDFSFNALYYDFRAGRIVDPLGVGRGDLDGRILRLVAHPEVLRCNSQLSIRVLIFLWRGYTPTPEVLAFLDERADRDIQKLTQRAPIALLQQFVVRQLSHRALDPAELFRLAAPYVRDDKTWRLIESLFRVTKPAG